MKKVAVIVGSKSDISMMDGCFKVLNELCIPFDSMVLSAHRTPDELLSFCKNAERNYYVIIAAAGYAAQLAGFIAARTVLPVIGIPLPSSSLQGLDALLSTVQMPSGVPVATVTIGEAGAKNAAVLATEIIALKYPKFKQKLMEYREKLRRSTLGEK